MRSQPRAPPLLYLWSQKLHWLWWGEGLGLEGVQAPRGQGAGGGQRRTSPRLGPLQGSLQLPPPSGRTLPTLPNKRVFSELIWDLYLVYLCPLRQRGYVFLKTAPPPTGPFPVRDLLHPWEALPPSFPSKFSLWNLWGH